MNNLELITSRKFLPLIISILLHPVMIPTFGVSIILNVGYFNILPFELKYRIIAIVFGVTAFIPITLVSLLKFIGVCTNMQMQTNDERKIPLLLVAFANYVMSSLIVGSIKFVGDYLLIVSVVIVIAMLINFFWKISLHAVGLGGIIGLIFLLNLQYFGELNTVLIVGILLSGITLTCRLWLQAHSPAQVHVGFAIGFIICAIGCFISINFG